MSASISSHISVTPAPSAEERLVAAQAKIAKAMADKEAAKAAAAAAKEAAIALKAAAAVAEKARRAEERAATKAAREAEKAALPKRPVGRPRKNPIATAVAAPTPDDSMDETSSTSSVEPPNKLVTHSSPGARPTDTVESLRAELAELRTQLTVIQSAYQREHAFLDRARKLFATVDAPV